MLRFGLLFKDSDYSVSVRTISSGFRLLFSGSDILL